MAKTYDLFTGLEPLTLTQLQLTSKKLGGGSYATVYEVIYNGVKCAGKEIHRVLLEQGDYSYTLRRFAEECRILSRLNHPNIVQFHGVYFKKNERVPMLVMELLMIDLTSHVKEHGVLPDEKAYSILHDVAEGLCYLHSLKPPVIHRDLSSNNVLLSYNMTAKISDFGVARMLNLSPLQVSSLTEMPGTRTFMPPEVDSANPSYDTSVDVFSFGVIMIHILSGKWPQPQWSQFRIEDDKKIPLSEAERRDVFLQTIRYKHPMMDLILKCIDDIPRYRGDANDILRSLETLQFVKKADSIEVEEETGQKELSAEDESVIDGHQQLSQDASEMISVGVTRTKEEDCGANQESLITISDNSTGGGPTSVLAQGLSHIKADLIDIKDTIKSAVTEIFDYATSVPLQKGSQTSPDVTVSSASADQEELQYRMKAEEQYDIIVVPSNVAKKHLEQDQSLMSSSMSTPLERPSVSNESLLSLKEQREAKTSQTQCDAQSPKLQPSGNNVREEVFCLSMVADLEANVDESPAPIDVTSSQPQSLLSHSCDQGPHLQSLFAHSSDVIGRSAPEFGNMFGNQHVPPADEQEGSSSSSSEGDGEACSEDWVQFCGSMWLRSRRQQQLKGLSLSPSDRCESLSNDDEILSPNANIFVPISSPSQHTLQSISLSEKLLWAVDSECSIYYKATQGSHNYNWRKLKGKMHQISTSSSGKNVWGVCDRDVLVRMGVGMNYEGRKWKNITKKTNLACKVKQIAVDETAAWALTTDGEVYFRGKIGYPYEEGREWQEVDSGSSNFSFIACCQDVVWAIDTTGRGYCRKGISYNMPSGRKWKAVHMPPLVSMSITDNGVVWGMSRNKSIRFRRGVSASKPSGTGPWWEVHVNFLPDTESSVVSQAGISFFNSLSTFRDSLSLLGFDNPLSISASSKSGVVVYEKGRHLHACVTAITGFHYTPALKSDLFPSMTWNQLAASGCILWLVSSDNGHLYALLSEEKLARVDCPARIDRIAASSSCVWIMSKDHIWSSSTKVPECLMFEEVEVKVQLPKIHLHHIACGKRTAWAVDTSGIPYFRFGTHSCESGHGMSLAWIPVEDNPQPLLMIAVSPDDRLVWACDEKFNVYARVGVTAKTPIGQKWELIPNQQAKELCADNEKVYALSENGELICRYGISESNVQGNYWKKMPGKYEHITVGEGGELWTMDDKGRVWKQEWTVVSVQRVDSHSDQSELEFEDENERPRTTSVSSADSWEVV